MLKKRSSIIVGSIITLVTAGVLLMLVLWPSDIYNTGDRPVYPVIINVIKALSPYVRVDLMAQSEDQVSQIKNLLQSSGYYGNNRLQADTSMK